MSSELNETARDEDAQNEVKPSLILLDWEVVAETCTLNSKVTGSSVRITPRGMEVLMYLIANREQVTSANLLLDLFWSKSVRSDHAVHNVIAELRSALGDRASDPRYIKTYHKLGYALLPKPKYCSEEIVSEDNPSVDVLSKSRKHVHAYLAVTLSVAFVFLSVAMGLRISNSGAVIETEQLTLLVLPFEDVNVEENNLYLSKQFPGSLFSRLKKMPGSQVQVFQGDEDKSPFVDYVLGGSIQLGSGAHRVQVDLTDAQNNVILFSEQFILGSEDIFEVQDRIVHRVATALRIILDEELRENMLDWGTTNAFAYDAFLKAEFYSNVSNHASFTQAIANYQLSINHDPDFVSAYVGLATVATRAALYSRTDTNISMRELVDYSLRELLRLEPGSVNTSAVQLLSLRVEGDNQKIIEERLREMILAGNSPSFTFAHYSTLLSGAKLFRESSQFLNTIPNKVAFKVSPDATWDYRGYVALPEDIISIKKKQLLDRPDHLGILAALSRAYAFNGDCERAKSYLRRVMQLDSEGPITMFTQVIISSLFGSSTSEGDLFEVSNMDNPEFNFSLGVKLFIRGDIPAGIEKWRQLNAAETRRLFAWIRVAELYFPVELLTDERYERLLEDLNVGKTWQHQLMVGVIEMSSITEIELSKSSTESLSKNERIVRNNLWDHSKIHYPTTGFSSSPNCNNNCY